MLYQKTFEDVEEKLQYAWSQQLRKNLPKTWKVTQWKEENISIQSIRRTQASMAFVLGESRCSGRMFYGVMWPDQNFLDPWISKMSGPNKRAKLMSRRTPSLWSNIEENQSCYGGVLLLQEGEIIIVWRTSWILWSIRPFWEESWCLWCKDWRWWSMYFLAGQSSLRMHPNLLVLASGISCRMFLSGLLSLQI